MLACVVAALTLVGVVPAHADGPHQPVLSEAPGGGWEQPADVNTEAYLLVEVATGQRLVAVNADVRRPVASTVKTLTAYSVIRRTALDEVVTVGEEVIGVPGAGAGLAPGDEWTVEQLLDALIGRSGNDAAEALAVHVGGSRDAFLRAMEEDAAALGIDGLHLVSPSGLADTQLLSAQDLATIAMAVLDEPDLRPLLSRRVVVLPGQDPVESRNELLSRYPDATGVKTGFTNLAGYSLIGSAERGERELLAVVLGAGEDPARFVSAATLLDHGYDTTRTSEVGTDISVLVAGGRLNLTVPPTTVTIPTGSEASLELTLPVRPPEQPLSIPVLVDGEALGTMTAEPTGGSPPGDEPAAQLGRALVDGTYAAMRAATAAGTL